MPGRTAVSVQGTHPCLYKQMGKGLLLTVTALMLAGGLVLHHGIGRTARQAGYRTAEYQSKALAREIALSAYEVGAQRVRNEGRRLTGVVAR